MTIERFMHKVAIDFETHCWMWQGPKTQHGYGNVKFKRDDGAWTGTSAHRWLWQAYFGPLPKDIELDHLCRNRACVNYSHLEPVTHRENMARGSNATRTHCKHGHSLHDAYVYKQGPNGAWRCRTCRTCRAMRYQRQKAQAAT